MNSRACIYRQKINGVLQDYVNKNTKKRKTFRVYHAIPDLDIPGKKDCFKRLVECGISDVVENKNVLDIGSSMGMMSIGCAQHNAKSVTGIEIEQSYFNAAELIKDFYNLYNVKFINCSFGKFIKHNEQKFDIILSLAVHRWVKQFDKINLKSYLEHLTTMLCSGGWLFFESHRRDAPKRITQQLKLTNLAIKKILDSDNCTRNIWHLERLTT